MMKYLPPEQARSPGLLRKTGAIVATAAVAGVALVFSALLLATVAAVGAAAFAYMWWKTRHLRRQMRDFSSSGVRVERGAFRGGTYEGEVIEGEARRVDEPRGRIAD